MSDNNTHEKRLQFTVFSAHALVGPAVCLAFGLFAVPNVASAQVVDAGKTAFSGRCDITQNSAQNLDGSQTYGKCEPSVSIPAGKRWVIEEVGARCMLATTGTAPALRSASFLPALPTGAPGTYQRLRYQFVETATTVGSDGVFNIRTWSGAIRGRFYTDIQPMFEASRFAGFLHDATCEFSASGYLIDK